MEDLQEIKADVKELLQRSAVHNELLRTHESRSLALQKGQELLDTRIKPIEIHVHFINTALKAIGVIGSGVLVSLLVRELSRILN